MLVDKLMTLCQLHDIHYYVIAHYREQNSSNIMSLDFSISPSFFCSKYRYFPLHSKRIGQRRQIHTSQIQPLGILFTVKCSHEMSACITHLPV